MKTQTSNAHHRLPNGNTAPAANGARSEPVESIVRQLLTAVGEQPDRPGLAGTPRRIARMYKELLSGYEQQPAELVNGALFDVAYDDMVVVQDIEFFSMCEHHMLPFFGRAHVAYIPRSQVIGLSKIPRLVDMYARRLQIQERMTQEIAAQLELILDAEGVAVVVEGVHLCSVMRGVRKEQARMITSAMRGLFHEDRAIRGEFMQQIQLGRPILF